MADKDHWGKIACHFPARGNPNADVWNIEFLPKGGNSTVAVDRVYMIPKGVSVSTIPELQHYIVWTTDVTLVQENDVACIEFVPPRDIALANVAIFSVDSVTGSSINFAIYHESGLVVAKSDNGSQTSMTKFDQSGKRWLTALSGVTLKKGLTYYIQFTGGSNNDIIKPVVMDGWYGNYKKFSHGQVQSKQVANLNNAHRWIGEIDTTQGIFAMTPGDFFMWNSSGWTPGMQNGHIYMRSRVGAGIPFSGVVGNPQSQGTLTTADLTTFLAKPLGSAFIWYVSNYSSMSSGSIWQKTTSTENVNLMDIDQYGEDNDSNTARIMYALQTVSKVMISAGKLWYEYPNSIGSSLSLKSGFNNRVTSMTPLTSLPSDMAVNDILYLQSGNYVVPGHSSVVYLNGGVHIYDGTDMLKLDTSSSAGKTIIYTDVLNRETLDSYLTYIGTNSDLMSSQYGGADWDGNYQSDGIRTATVYNDEKHYLEINGEEF